MKKGNAERRNRSGSPHQEADEQREASVPFSRKRALRTASSAKEFENSVWWFLPKAG
jgi:hypothetical protein